LLSILAVLAAALMPLSAPGQVDQESGSATPQKLAPIAKYQAYVGYGYTSLNQVNQSRHGLQGVEVSLTRNWGRHFGITADGGEYSLALGSGNPGKPTVAMAFLGPEFHLPIWGAFSGYVHGLMGIEHTGGENQTPNISFAGGIGGGVDYSLGRRFAIRAAGDDIASSFSVNNPVPGDSAHMTRSTRATFGFVYKF
jgi:hypothetical protein